VLPENAADLSREQSSQFLSRLAPHLPPALQEVGIPAYVLDRSGRIRWLNEAAKAMVGDVVGHLFTSVVDPKEVGQAKVVFAKKLRGEQQQDFAIDLLTPDGSETRVEISSVALRGNRHAIGVFGFAIPRGKEARRPPKLDSRLTPRQRQVLELLGEGATTDQIAERLEITRETARNHVRHILQRLGARSRLEAVALAHREELL
jgi:DNA-binding CsgD family transcriptional regulator